MSCTSRAPEGFEATNFGYTFATAVAAAIEQILSALEQLPGNQKVTFAISPALARTDILRYSSGLGAKIFSKATESLPTILNIRKPNISILLNDLLLRSETYVWNDLLTIIYHRIYSQHTRIFTYSMRVKSSPGRKCKLY
jgi:hypothetical protein